MKLDKFISMAIEQGASDVAINIYNELNRIIRFSNNEITIVKEIVEKWAEIYVAIKEKRAIVEVNDVSPNSIKKAVREALEIARRSQPSEIYAPLPQGPYTYNSGLLKPGRINMSPEKLVDYVEAAVNAALSEKVGKVAGILTCSKGRRMIKTSSGVESESYYQDIELSIRAFASEDATGHFVSIAADRKDFDPEAAGRKAGEIAKLSINPKVEEPGTYEALLGPMISANFIEHVGNSASAFYVDAGLSFLADKIGEQVASKIFTLVDDPTIPRVVGTEPFDDEGLPTRRNVIVRDGVLETYLHNSTTAKKFGVESTANAGLIIPRPFNLLVEGEGRSLEDLIASIDDGIYVTNNWYLRYQNYRTGDFSTLPRDGMFRIKNGSIEYPVKGLRISDNMLNILKGIREISREKYWIKWWEVETPVYAPYIVLEKLTFTKPQ
ncbi:MAG: TldD/PmbA family protein [Nitrososphaerota archaeon]